MPRKEKPNADYLRRLRRLNYLKPGMPLPVRLRKAPLMLIFSVKVRDRSVSPPFGLRVRRPFWKGEVVEQELWWRDLGRVTYIEARQITAKYLDQIKHLVDRQEPLVAIRATLVDFNEGEPIARTLLLDPWFFTTSYNGRKLNAEQLNAWGISSNYSFQPREFTSYPAKKAGEKEAEADTNFFVLLGRVLDLSISQAVSLLISTTLPRWMRAASVMQLQPDKRQALLQARRAIMALRNEQTINRLKAHLADRFQSDADFAKRVRGATVRTVLKQAAVEWLNKEVAERYFTLQAA